MSKRESLRNQLADAFDRVLITGMDNNGVTFDLSIPKSSIVKATLEESVDVMRREIDELQAQFEVLVKSGERTKPVESWSIIMDGNVLSDGIESEDKAYEILEQSAERLEERLGLKGVARLSQSRAKIVCDTILPQSYYIANITHKINARLNQIDQTLRLIEKVA